MATLQERLQDLSTRVDEASSKLDQGRSVSPALRAVVSQLRTKAHRAVEHSRSVDASHAGLRDCIIELEQAADSATAAAKAEPQMEEASRSAILRAHTDASALKKELLNPDDSGDRSPAQENL